MITRRNLMSAAGAVSLCAGRMAYGAVPAFRPERIEQAYEAFIRLIGSLSPGTVYESYSGVVFGVVPGAAAAPLLRFQGITKTVWSGLDGGGLRSRRYDVMVFSDYLTRSAVTAFKNPMTDWEVDVPVVATGPESLDHSVELMRVGRRAMYSPNNWQQSGATLSHGYEVAFSYPHPLKPAVWPDASPGERGFSTIATTSEAPVQTLLDPNVDSARATRHWLNVTSWSPWLKLGQMPGSLAWRARGEKGVHVNELPEEIRARVGREVPGFFEAQEPWSERRDEFQQYIQSQAPKPVA